MICEIDSKIFENPCNEYENNGDISKFLDMLYKKIPDSSNSCVEELSRTFMSYKDVTNCINKLYNNVKKDILEEISKTNNGFYELKIYFLLLFTYYRRQKQVTEMNNLIQLFTSHLNDTPVMLHARAMYYEKNPENYENMNAKLIVPIRLEIQALEKDSDYFYAKHKFADLIAKLLEYGANVVDEDGCSELSVQKLSRCYLTKAENYLNDIIAENNRYARAYYTLAQIYMLTNRYNEAEESVLNAIDYEDETSKDYERRLTDYFILRQNIRTLRRSHNLIQKESIRLDSKLRETERKIFDAIRNNEERVERRFSLFIAITSILLTYLYATGKAVMNISQLLLITLLMYSSIIIVLIITYVFYRRLDRMDFKTE